MKINLRIFPSYTEAYDAYTAEYELNEFEVKKVIKGSLVLEYDTHATMFRWINLRRELERLEGMSYSEVDFSPITNLLKATQQVLSYN